MVFWKNALLGVMLTFCSAVPAQSKEPEPVKQELKVQNELKLEERLKEDWNKPKKYTSKDWRWTVIDTDISGSVSVLYKLPDGFTFNLDGSLNGRGFTWKIGEKDFYYQGEPILEYFKSLENLGNTYMDDLRIGGKSLNRVIDIFNSEKDIVGNSFYENLEDFKDELLNIYSDQYSEDFVYGLITSMLTDDLDSFLDKEKVTEKQREQTEEAVEDFFEDMDYIFKYTKSDDIIRKLMGGDPFDNISLKGRSLRDILDLVEGFGNLMDTQTTDDRITAKLRIESVGTAKAELSFTNKIRQGEWQGTFDHTMSGEYNCYGKINFDLNLKFEDGLRISEFFGVDPLVVLLYGLTKIDICLKDLYLNSVFNFNTSTSESLSESFELSRQLKDGKEGVGVIYERRRIYQEKSFISLVAAFRTEGMELEWDYKEQWKNMLEKRDRNLLYVLSERKMDNYWYSMMMGFELYKETYRWNTRTTINNSVKKDGGKEEGFNLKPRFNMAAGWKGKGISPFASVTTFPESYFKVGTLLDFPYLTAKVSLQCAIEDENYQRQLLHPFENPEFFTADASTVLFDREGNRKMMSHYIESEKIDVSPRLGKQTMRDKAMRSLYSDINGLLVNTGLAGPEFKFRAVYGADSSFFVGGGYFTNTAENLHGVDFVICYDDFLFKGRYCYSCAENQYAHSINISAGGNIGDLFAIYLDLKGFFLNDTEAKDYGVSYGENDTSISLRFAGFF